MSFNVRVVTLRFLVQIRQDCFAPKIVVKVSSKYFFKTSRRFVPEKKYFCRSTRESNRGTPTLFSCSIKSDLIMLHNKWHLINTNIQSLQTSIIGCQKVAYLCSVFGGLVVAHWTLEERCSGSNLAGFAFFGDKNSRQFKGKRVHCLQLTFFWRFLLTDYLPFT